MLRRNNKNKTEKKLFDIEKYGRIIERAEKRALKLQIEREGK